jgi:uncharacterized protein
MTSFILEPDLPRGDVVAGDPAGRGVDKLLVGKLLEAGAARKLYLDITGEQVVGVLGKRGSGKSFTLGVLIEGLAAGKGKSAISELVTPRGGLVFDIMDIYWSSTLPLQSTGSAEIVKQYNRMADQGLKSQPLAIQVWLPGGFEMPAIDPPGIRSLRMQASDLGIDDWAALFNVDIYSEPRGMLLADLVTKVGTEGYQTASGSRIPPNARFTFSDLLQCLDGDVALAAVYAEPTRRSVRQRLTSYAALPLFQGDGTPLSEVIQAFSVSVLMLSRVPDELKKVIVGVLLKRILRERSAASFAQKRLDLATNLTAQEAEGLRQFVQGSIPRTWVFLDEAHVLAGAQTSVAGEALVKFAKEGRNYGLSLAVATQQPTALDSRLMSQAETLVIHQLTAPSDAAVATAAVRSPPPTAIKIDSAPADLNGLFRRLAQGEAVFSSGNAPLLPRACVTSVRPRVSAHGGYEA